MAAAIPVDIPVGEFPAEFTGEFTGAGRANEGLSDYDSDDCLHTCTSLPTGRRGIDEDSFSLLSGSLSPKSDLEITSKCLRRWKRSLTANVHSYQRWDFSEVSDAVSNAALKLSEGKLRAEPPERQGVSGTYFFKSVDSSMNVLGVFKPVDEEASLEDVYHPEADRPSKSVLKYVCHAFNAGEGAFREQAAYLLDRDSFASVPQTTMAACDVEVTESGPKRTKTGAFQVYVQNLGDADDFGPGVFSEEDVQRIAALDVRTLNCDRHGGNILVCPNRSASSKKHRLVPIDHGYTLPDRVVACPWPVWMDWPQAHQPITPSVREYIQRLDGEQDAALLRQNGALRAGSLLTLKIGTLLLQMGAEAGLSMHEIGALMFTKDFAQSTFLEKAGNEAYSIGLARQSRQMHSTSVDMRAPCNRCATSSPVWELEMDLYPETEAFVFKYTERLIKRKIDAVAKRGLGLGRHRSTPDLAVQAAREACVSGPQAHVPCTAGWGTKVGGGA